VLAVSEGSSYSISSKLSPYGTRLILSSSDASLSAAALVALVDFIVEALEAGVFSGALTPFPYLERLLSVILPRAVLLGDRAFLFFKAAVLGVST